MTEFARIVDSPLSPVMIVEDTYGGGSQVSVGLRKLNVRLASSHHLNADFNNEFWIEHQVNRYFNAGGTHCIFVVNRWDDSFRSVFKKLKLTHENVSFVVHPFPEKGILGAIQAGFSHLKLQANFHHRKQNNCWILPIDVPAPLRGVWQQIEHSTQFHPQFDIIQPSFLGKPGYPALLSQAAIQHLDINPSYQKMSSIFELKALCNPYECYEVKVSDPQVIEKIRKSENWDRYLDTSEKFGYLSFSKNSTQKHFELS